MSKSNDLFIIAELSANHCGSIDTAKRIIREAKKAGADAVKLQTYTPENMVAGDYILEEGLWKRRGLLGLYKQGCTPWIWHKELFNHAKEIGIELFSSPFDLPSVDFLEDLGCPRYKIASFELNDTPLIRAVAKTGKPIIMSIGCSTKEEIEIAVKEARRYGPRHITLLKCTSAYPAEPKDANLNTLSAMYFEFKTHVGVSDHSPGVGVSCAAAALGASIIEKHLTLDRQGGGLDAEFSMEPDEFAQLVTECHRASQARGGIKYGSTQKGFDLRRSLYFAKDLKAGTVIKETDIKTARPFASVSPQDIDKVIGQVIINSVKCNQSFAWSLVDANKQQH